MPANNRIYYASQSVQLQPQNSDGSQVAISGYVPQGLQSVGMTTNFSLQPVFQLGQLELYDNLENVPEVEVTLNKVVDGTPPLYAMCMCGPSGISNVNDTELVELVNNRVNFRLGIWPDTFSATTGTATHHVDCSGMYLSRFNFTLPIDGNATEEVTLVGNNKIWNTGAAMTTSEFNPSSGNSPTAPGIVRRYSVDFTNTVLPTGDAGIPIPADRDIKRPYVQNITISADLGREAIQEIGSMAPYFRYVRFPLEVKSEFQIIASDGDTIDASDFSQNAGCGKSYRNVKDKQVKLVLCAGAGSGLTGTLGLDLGSKNKLTSVNYSGGDTGGGNATVTYSFQTYNKFKMTLGGTFGETRWIDNAGDTDNYYPMPTPSSTP
jgi:hypothetical protein